MAFDVAGPSLDGPGIGAYRRLMGMEGADQAAAVAAGVRLYDFADVSAIRTFYLAAGANTLSLAMARSGILTSTSSGATSLLIPTMATMGHVRSGVNPNELVILLYRDGDGVFTCNPASGVTITWNNLDIQYRGKWSQIVTLRSRGVDHYVAG
jgi:hypothetical protein